MRICVFCASSAKIDNSYFKATELLAKDIVKNNIEVVYGGGAIGLMGKLADTIIENGGKIKGIIPRFMYDLGWAHKKVTDLVITDTMFERKQLHQKWTDPDNEVVKRYAQFKEKSPDILKVILES